MADPMDRRDFVAATLAVGALLVAPAVARAESTPDTPAPDGALPPFPFAELSVATLQSRMAKGTLTSRALTAAYLARIALIDAAGPTLRSVIERNPDALSIAAAMDAERRAGKVRGPLHGIPVLIKDNIDTADRMQTTAGSMALFGTPAPRDASIVERLRAAGRTSQDRRICGTLDRPRRRAS